MASLAQKGLVVLLTRN
jgi:small subunit ribosomal protein S7